MQTNKYGMFRQRAAALVLILSVAAPAALQAQSVALGGIERPGVVDPTVKLSLPAAIAAALNSSSALQIATRTIGRDEARVQMSKDVGGPKVGADISAQHFDAATVMSLGSLGTFTLEPQDDTTYSIGASLPIDISGQIKAETDAAKLQLLSDRFARDTVVNNLVFATEAAYFGLLRAQHQVQVAQAALDSAKAQQKIASAQYDAGTGQRLDLLRANTQVANGEQMLLQAKNAFSLAQVNLNDTVGRPLPTGTTVEDVPGVTSGTVARPVGKAPFPGDVDSNTPPAYFGVPHAEIDAIDVSATIKSATDARPELRQDLTNIQAARKSIKLARADLEPTLTLSAGGDFFQPLSFAHPRTTIRVVGLDLNIPVFDGGITRDKIKDANDSVEIARTAYDAHKNDVAKQVRQAYLNLLNAAQQIESANVALQQAVAARDLAQTRFEGGVGLYLEVTDSQAALTSAENSQVNAVYDYMVARAQFENASGAPNLKPVLPAILVTQPSALPAPPALLPESPAPPTTPSPQTSPSKAPAPPVVRSIQTNGSNRSDFEVARRITGVSYPTN